MNSSPPETRASLILRLPNAADAKAWDELLEVYGPIVYRLALRRGIRPADADDLVQEVFVAIAKSITKWLERDDRGKFHAWLLRIARNIAVNFLTRPSYRMLGMGGDDAMKAIASLIEPESELSTEFDLEYRREVFQWAAEQLRQQVSDTTWQAFCLTHIDGMPIASAAEQLGISVGSVYVARSRFMSRLQELVKTFEVPE